jgi:hypothetical protein
MVASGQRMFTKRTSNDVADYLFSFETTKPSKPETYRFVEVLKVVGLGVVKQSLVI